MSFNGIARKKNGDVIGKLSLSTLKNLPASWDIIYWGSFIPKDTDLGTLLCDSKFPLSVYTISPGRIVTLNYESRYTSLISFTSTFLKEDTVKDLKGFIHNEIGCEISEQILFYKERKLKDEEILEEFLFRRKSVIHVKITLYLVDPSFKFKRRSRKTFGGYVGRAGGGFGGGAGGGYGRVGAGPGGARVARPTRPLKAIDLEAEHVEGRGIPVRNRWEGYSYGLNIYGTCPNKHCDSHKIECEQTTFRARYGFLRIDLKNKLLPCPACETKFPPGNFAVCNARALFRFRKTGGHFEVQSTVLESSGGIGEYAMFNSEAPDEDYDWIEVKTVKYYESVYVCVKCDMPIGERTDGVLYECSHPVHRKCLEKDCCLCKAKVLTDKQIRGLATDGKLLGPGSSGGRSRGIRGRGRGTRGRRKK